MDCHKGKPANTSVPSMSIRFNATSEEIEELFDCEEDNNENIEIEKDKITDLESSPRRSILPLLSKRTSVEVQDASPPSDPWRFLSDIKGKITKSVEVKFTEYKSKNLEEGSPKNVKVKDSKDNSSLSDSEEVSESSISRTCGFVSTTEGVEMSSDDDDDNTPSLSEEQDKLADDSQKQQQTKKSTNTGIKQRYKVINAKTSKEKEGTVSLEFVESVQKITEEDEEVESGIDVLADLNVSNFKLDKENILNIHQITGEEIREKILNPQLNENGCETIFSPIGFVDLRPKKEIFTFYDYLKKYQSILVVVLALIVYYFIPLSSYLNGFILGVLLTFTIAFIYFKLNQETLEVVKHPVQILKVPSVREHQPLKKYEGWMNEFPEEYDPQTYHIMDTQSVYLRLQGNFLRISNTRHKIPKRAMWNESEHKVTFSSHRIYNLMDAKVSLLPDGIAKIRYWSKKYPICITLNKDQLNIEDKDVSDEDLEKKKVEVNGKSVKYIEDNDLKKGINNEENEEFTDVEESDEDEKLDLQDEEDKDNNLDWNGMNSDTKQKKSDQTKIYLFGRTDREKEDWFRRLVAATHSNAEECNPSNLEEEYVMYMKTHKEKVENVKNESNDDLSNDLWINSLITRVMFDAIREESVILKMKERIQRKLASIRLPYFIQELNCEELNLGTTSPIFTGAKSPELNDRGLWLDLDINYQGLIVVILQTKVNLLKLKQPQSVDVEKSVEGKSAIFHSDIDDSAESSTDEDSGKTNTTSVSDNKGPAGNRSKKIMKMVDRITESKIFQVASEYKYIKKAMQDISNTDLRLKVEFKKCIGKLVLNIPPPPSDRIWFGFRTPPDLLISACPIVGERNISFLRVTSWIEKIIYKEFQKIFVIPNMEDLPIPVMSPKLPE